MTPKIKAIPNDEEKGHQLMVEGRDELEKLANSGDGEAMRMLAYTYLKLLGIFDTNIPLAEEWLLRSYKSGCYFAANDLSSFYLVQMKRNQNIIMIKQSFIIVELYFINILNHNNSLQPTGYVAAEFYR